jgi:hypothetical protein
MRQLVVELKNKLWKVITWLRAETAHWFSRPTQIVEGSSADDHSRQNDQSETLKDYLLRGPDLSELDLTRDKSLMREVEW